MTKLLLVGAGGFLGSVLRYGLSTLMAPWTSTFPWATLGINVAGCFLIGLLMPWAEGRPDGMVFVITGILGGFTTFSAFGHETHRLATGNSPFLAAAYVVASVGLGLAAVWIGRGLGRG